MAPSNRKFSNPLEVGRTTPAATAMKNVPPPPKRPSKYEAAMDAVAALKPDEATTIHRPSNISRAEFKQLIDSALRNFQLKAPAGHFFRKRFDKDNNLVVAVVPHKKE